MRSPYLSWFLALYLLAGVSLTACGTKGPLYIPEQRYPQNAEKTHAPQNQAFKPASFANQV